MRSATAVATVIAAAACLAASTATSAKVQDGSTELLSIRDVPLAANEYIGGFEIETQGVQILAACQVPYGWHVSLGDYDSIDGDMKGEARLGPTFVGKGDFGRLRGLFLVRVLAFTDKWNGDLPPTYRLSVLIGRYGSEAREHSRRLTLRSLERAPAQECPPPLR